MCLFAIPPSIHGRPRRSCFRECNGWVAVCLALLLLALALAGRPAQAAPYTVTNNNDSGGGSLREAVGTAGAGTINFASPLTGGNTIDLASSLSISQDLTILNDVAASGITISYLSGAPSLDSLLALTGGHTLALGGGGDPLTLSITGTSVAAIYSSSGSMKLGTIGSDVTVKAEATTGGGIVTGIRADAGAMQLTGDLAGTITAKANTTSGLAASRGLDVAYDLELTGDLSGTVTSVATATTATGQAFGVHSGQTLTIGSLSGTVTAESSGAAGFGAQSDGLSGGYLVITGGLSGTVTAKATGAANGESQAHGLSSSQTLNGGDANTPLLISGSVSATANGTAVAVYSGGVMNLKVTGSLSGVDTTGLGNGYAIKGGAGSSVTLATGASLTGKVDLGGGSSTLTLLGTGSADNLFLNVTNLVAGDGSTATSWTLDPPAANASTYGNLTVKANAALSINENVTISGNIQDDGALTFNLGANKTYGGVISGSGSLTKTGSGTLTLTADNTYTGPTVISAGTLSLSGASASVSMAVASGATLNFNPSRDLAYAGTISGNGHVTKTGTSTLTLSGDNSGFTGDTTISAGILSVASGNNLGASTASLIFNGGSLSTTAALAIAQSVTVAAGGGSLDNNGNAVTLSGTFTGPGDLTFSGSGTDTLDATFAGSGYTGTATLSAGAIQLTAGAVLGGSLVLNAGTKLQGIGTVGNLTNGGTVSPGNSIGTITVSGNFTQTPTGVYQSQLMADGTGDLITVTGSAALNGTLALQPQYTYYASGTVWTVLTAAGGVSGSFPTVTYTDTPENWIFVPIYTGNAVYVTLQRQSYAQSAESSQASAVGSSLTAVAATATGQMATLIKVLDYSYGTNTGYSASNALTNYTLNVLSAEPYDAFSQSLFTAGRVLTAVQRSGAHSLDTTPGQAFASPLDIGPSALAAVNGPDLATTGFGALSDGPILPGGRFGVFLRPFGLSANQQARSEQTGYHTLTSGITGGVLYRPLEALTLGLAPAFFSQSVRLHSEGGGQGTMNDWSLAVLAAYRQDGWHADAAIRGGYNTFKSSRNLPLPTGTFTAKGVFNGWNGSLSVGGGYDFTTGDYSFGPIASLDWQHQHGDAFRETEADTLGQSLRARQTDSLTTTLGARLARTFETDHGDITPELRAAWGAQWLGDSQHITAAFLGSPSSVSVVKTANPAYDSLLLDAGVSVRVSRSLSTSARFGVELFRPGYTAQAASLGIKYSF